MARLCPGQELETFELWHDVQAKTLEQLIEDNQRKHDPTHPTVETIVADFHVREKVRSGYYAKK
jgi:hypothetical protein